MTIELKTTHEQLIDSALRDIWGYADFRDHQRESIACVMAGRDSLTVLPTGGGKSLCYQLPASIGRGTAIVVSPLIALMADQVQGLDLLGIPAAYLNSSQTVEEVRRTKARMFNGELRLLYVSPERLMMEHFLDELTQIAVSFFAVDEAHCISQWGHDFRPEYKMLANLRHRFHGVGIHAFTATAPPAVQQEICRDLGLQQPHVMVGNYHRANLRYRVLRRNSLNKQILSLLTDFDAGDSGIIYCLTRKETEKTADFLNQNGYKALPYHAGMDAETRDRHQALFSQERVSIIVATVAFGMGIDQSNVRFVIHAGMPRSLSHYQQESGRAGRDGLPSQCTLIFSARDILFWKRIIEEEDQRIAHIRTRQLEEMNAYASRIKCRHRVLIEHFGQAFAKPNCGNCDICLGEIESIAEARKISRMIISAVLKLRETFGGAYVSLVLTGSKDKKVLSNRHDELSVYGLLSRHSQYQVHDWIDQLDSQGYLMRKGREFPTIGVTREGYWLLRPDKFEKTEDELPVFLIETRKGKDKGGRQEGKGDPTMPYDHDLFELLRDRRKKLAAHLGVPAFMVFGDKSLQDMARRKPVDEITFLDVFGVGKNKLDKFGKPMLKVIREYLGE